MNAIPFTLYLLAEICFVLAMIFGRGVSDRRIAFLPVGLALAVLPLLLDAAGVTGV